MFRETKLKILGGSKPATKKVLNILIKVLRNKTFGIFQGIETFDKKCLTKILQNESFRIFRGSKLLQKTYLTV